MPFIIEDDILWSLLYILYVEYLRSVSLNRPIFKFNYQQKTWLMDLL